MFCFMHPARRNARKGLAAAAAIHAKVRLQFYFDQEGDAAHVTADCGYRGDQRALCDCE